jgi:hypothetical protein
MEFIIENAVSPENKSNSFEVEITVMHGDGDSYEKLSIGPFYKGQDEAALENMLEALTNVSNAYSGMSGSDNYESVDGYVAWFTPDFLMSKEEYEKYYKPSSVSYEDYKRRAIVADAIVTKNKMEEINWPYDVTCEESPTEYVSHKVFYYDSELNKYNVTVKN